MSEDNKLFFKVASERNLVTNQINPTKQSIRDDLRLKGLDDEFTKIQSVVYDDVSSIIMMHWVHF